MLRNYNFKYKSALKDMHNLLNVLKIIKIIEKNCQI